MHGSPRRRQDFILTRNEVPVRREFVSKATVLAAFQHAPPVNARRFREDLDAFADQDPTPRS